MMTCPRCGSQLRRSTRGGVEIDVCAGCRGVWLDRGELDKIIDRSREEEHGPPPTFSHPPAPGSIASPPPIFGRPDFPPPPASPGDVPSQRDPSDVPSAAQPGRRRRSIWREVLEF